MSTNTELLTSNDLVNYFRVMHHADYILKYRDDYKLFANNILQVVTTEKYLKAIPDKIFIDAISFHFNAIRLVFGRSSKRFQQLLPEIPSSIQIQFLSDAISMGDTSYSFDEELESLEDIYDEEFFDWLDQLKESVAKIEDYFNSKEYLNHKLSMQEFINWKNNDGKIFVIIWLETIKELSKIELNEKDITKEAIRDAWDLYNKYSPNIKKFSIPTVKKTKIPLYMFLVALEYIAALHDNKLLKQLPYTEVPNQHNLLKQSIPQKASTPKKKKATPKKSPYTYMSKIPGKYLPITTSSSIWTVRNR